MTPRRRTLFTCAALAALAATSTTGCDKGSKAPSKAEPAPAPASTGGAPSGGAAVAAKPAPAADGPADKADGSHGSWASGVTGGTGGAGAAAAAKPAAGAPSGWYAYADPDGMYTLAFPSKPAEDNDSVDIPGIGPAKLRLVTLDQSDSSRRYFGASALRYEVPPGAGFDLEAALAGGRDQMLQSAGLHNAGERRLDTHRKDVLGADIDVAGPVMGQELNGRVRIYVSGNPAGVYVAQALFLGPLDAAATETFLDSFVLALPEP